MTLEAAKAKLRTWRDVICHPACTVDVCNFLLEYLEDVETAPRWIPCTERMPTEADLPFVEAPIVFEGDMSVVSDVHDLYIFNNSLYRKQWLHLPKLAKWKPPTLEERVAALEAKAK